MRLEPAQKKILLKEVQCTHYLVRKSRPFYLTLNQKDNKWYYHKDYNREYYSQPATTNHLTWKHNCNYDFRKKDFSGVVVKIENLPLSTILGISQEFLVGDFSSINYLTSFNKGCTVPAATVFFRNGAKRLVPLECIKEYEGFTDGQNTYRILNNIEEFMSENLPENKITQLEDGSIRIENTFNILDSENANLHQDKRALILDIKKRKVTFQAEKDNEWFPITNDEYKKVMDILNAQIKEECGFIPDVIYGQTNFDCLVNFTNYPFNPELNEFSKLFTRLSTEIQYTDCHDTPIAFAGDVEQELKYSPDCVRKFISYTGLPYSNKTNKLFLKGHLDFAEYLGIWHAGFRDEKVIEKLMAADYGKVFAQAIFTEAVFSRFFYDDDNEDTHASEVCLTFENESELYSTIRFLYCLYHEKSVAKLLSQVLVKNTDMHAYDTLQYMELLYHNENLPQDVSKKIEREGLTSYNHDLLFRMYMQERPLRQGTYENKIISYSEDEQSLIWENSGYKFCLPENTERLVDIGAKMNICVGHLYRDKAVNKECTIVFAQKDDEYELCIEVAKQNDSFHLVQRSAFNNSSPQGQTLEVFKQWCRVKGVC